MRQKSEAATAHVPPSVKAAIRRLAQKRGVSESQILKLFIARGLSLESLVDRGGKIVAIMPDGNEHIIADYAGEYTLADR